MIPPNPARVEIAIVGLGSWGLCALERFVTSARGSHRRSVQAQVHVIEPRTPGAGLYEIDQPDYLIMNNPCGQLSLYPESACGGSPQYGVGFYDWVRLRGYRWIGDACRIDPNGRAVTPHDFLPRRIMGEYLRWFYQAVVAEAPSNLQIVRHRSTAVDLVPQPGGQEQVRLADGRSLFVDHVILTCGHTANVSQRLADSALAGALAPYPVDRCIRAIPKGVTVGVSGMGLVAADVVAALTVGRGGQFIDDGRRMRYVRSGREPLLHLFSRSGLPYCAKSVSSPDDTGDYQAAISTPAALAWLRHGPGRDERGGPVDVRADLLPLVFAEMQLRFYCQSATLSESPDAARCLRSQLTDAWRNGDFVRAVAVCARRYGRFEPDEHFFGNEGRMPMSSKDYNLRVYETVEADLDQALIRGGMSPIKAAYEVLRILRDDMRSVIEFKGMSASSYLDFQLNLRKRITRLIAGPPALRSQQLLALMDSEVVCLPYGRSPAVEFLEGPRARVKSRFLEDPHSSNVDYMIQGHLDEPTVHRSASPLLSTLYGKGRLQQLHYGDVSVGSVSLTEESHPINARNDTEKRIWMFGPLTEGVRYFTHYIPSPRSRQRAFIDLQTCVEQIMS